MKRLQPQQANKDRVLMCKNYSTTGQSLFYVSLPNDSVSLSELKEEYLLSPCKLVSMATGGALLLLLQVLVESLLATDILSPSRFKSVPTSCALIKSRWRARLSRRLLVVSAGKHARLVARQQKKMKHSNQTCA